MSRRKLTSVIVTAVIIIVIVLGAVMFSGNLFKADSVTLSPVAEQTRKLWQSDSRYGSSDFIPEEQGLLYGGRAQYIRFAAEDIDGADIEKATIRINAMAHKGEKNPYLAVVAISDSRAINIEKDLKSETANLRAEAGSTSDPNHQFLLADDGMYAKDVVSSVTAYEKGVAGDTPATKNTYTENGLSFDLPVSFELDVTNAAKAAFGKNNHVQFALLPDKNVYKNDLSKVSDMTGFARFENGSVYDADGNVIENTDALNLNLSAEAVCGGDAKYYSALKSNPASFNDDYYSWIFLPQNSITLYIEYTDEGALYKEIKNSADAKEFEEKIGLVSRFFDEDVWTAYNEIKNDTDISQLLFEEAKKTSSLKKFTEKFAEIVTDTYRANRQSKLDIVSDLGGARGEINLISAIVPELAYATITTYNEVGDTTGTFFATVKNGKGFYNVFDKDKHHSKIEITVASDEARENIISEKAEIAPQEVALPELFITEISNEHTRTYYPDPTGVEHTGTTEQNYQYIEITNYNETPVDLNDYSFVYNNGKDHSFNWIFESGSNSVINPGEICVIGVYSADTAKKGYTYDSDASIAKYWEDFGTFHNTNVPVESRVLIACVESGNADAVIDGMDHLERSRDVFDRTGERFTVTARIMKGEEIITAISLPDDNPGSSYSYNFIPSAKSESKEQQFLYGAGCFPNKLLKEQILDYCEPVYISDTDAIKVMSYNVLAKETPTTRVIDRAPLFFRTIDDYQPDVIGLQEVNHLWIPQLRSQMPSNYSCVEGVSSRNSTYETAATNTVWDTFRPIYFRNDRFELIESGTAFLTPDGKATTKVWDSIRQTNTMTWASLKDKETGEVINVINTHNTLSGDVARVEQVKLLQAKGAELKAKNKGGVVIVGDHNFYENSEPYIEYINNGGLVDTKYETANHLCIASCTNFNSNDKDHIGTIDFCFVGKDDFVTQRYEVFDGIYPEGIVSDHSAVYAEIITKGRVTNVVTE